MIVFLRGHGAQNGAALQNVFDGLLGAGIVEAAFFFEPGDGCRDFGLTLRDSDRRSRRASGR